MKCTSIVCLKVCSYNSMSSGHVCFLPTLYSEDAGPSPGFYSKHSHCSLMPRQSEFEFFLVLNVTLLFINITVLKTLLTRRITFLNYDIEYFFNTCFNRAQFTFTDISILTYTYILASSLYKVQIQHINIFYFNSINFKCNALHNTLLAYGL